MSQSENLLFVSHPFLQALQSSPSLKRVLSFLLFGLICNNYEHPGSGVKPFDLLLGVSGRQTVGLLTIGGVNLFAKKLMCNRDTGRLMYQVVLNDQSMFLPYNCLDNEMRIYIACHPNPDNNDNRRDPPHSDFC